MIRKSEGYMDNDICLLDEVKSGRKRRMEEVEALGPQFVKIRKNVNFELSLPQSRTSLNSQMGQILTNDGNIPPPYLKLKRQ